MAWATKIRVNPTQIVITELETKWGSCAPDGLSGCCGEGAGKPGRRGSKRDAIGRSLPKVSAGRIRI